MIRVIWSAKLLRMAESWLSVLLLVDPPRTVPSSSPLDFWLIKFRAIGTILTFEDCFFFSAFLFFSDLAPADFLRSLDFCSVYNLYGLSLSSSLGLEPYVISKRCFTFPLASIWVLLLIPDRRVGCILFCFGLLLTTGPDLAVLLCVMFWFLWSISLSLRILSIGVFSSNAFFACEVCSSDYRWAYISLRPVRAAFAFSLASICESDVAFYPYSRGTTEVDWACASTSLLAEEGSFLNSGNTGKLWACSRFRVACTTQRDYFALVMFFTSVLPIRGLVLSS